MTHLFQRNPSYIRNHCRTGFFVVIMAAGWRNIYYSIPSRRWAAGSAGRKLLSCSVPHLLCLLLRNSFILIGQVMTIPAQMIPSHARAYINHRFLSIFFCHITGFCTACSQFSVQTNPGPFLNPHVHCDFLKGLRKEWNLFFIFQLKYNISCLIRNFCILNSQLVCILPGFSHQPQRCGCF